MPAIVFETRTKWLDPIFPWDGPSDFGRGLSRVCAARRGDQPLAIRIHLERFILGN